MQPLGTFSLVLHTHLPYCRNAGRWPHGEEWLYEAAAETYIPLLEAFSDETSDIGHALTLSLTPVLVEQLASPEVISGTSEFIQDREKRAQRDVARFESSGDVRLADIAHFYQNWYSQRQKSLNDRFRGDLIAAFRTLREQGHIEIITSSATHAFLPLLARDSSVYSQIHTGVESFARHFGTKPEGFWLPECAYRPALLEPGGSRPGLEEFLSAEGIRFFFVESHAISGAAPETDLTAVPRNYRSESREVHWSSSDSYTGKELRDTARPYLVRSSDVAAIARNQHLSMQVWSAGSGYPGDPIYREFHRKDDVSGLHYWAITGRDVDLGDKCLYEPDKALARTTEHARHFASKVLEELERKNEIHGSDTLLVAAFDTELFGHWWFEGVAWLRQVVEVLSRDGRVRLEPISAYLHSSPPSQALDLPASTWGAGGDARTWLNPLTDELWQRLHKCEQQMESLVQNAVPASEDYLRQTCRELLLAESSDWPFLITTGQAKEYGRRRFDVHCERFRILSRLAQSQDDSPASRQYLAEVQKNDELFPDIDWQWFSGRQGSAIR